MAAPVGGAHYFVNSHYGEGKFSRALTKRSAFDFIFSYLLLPIILHGFSSLLCFFLETK